MMWAPYSDALRYPISGLVRNQEPRALSDSDADGSVEVLGTFAKPVLPFPSKPASVSIRTLFFSHSLQNPKVKCSNFISAVSTSTSTAYCGCGWDAALLGLGFANSILSTDHGSFGLAVVAMRKYAFRSCAEKVSGIDPT
jgi:hypothetical protein